MNSALLLHRHASPAVAVNHLLGAVFGAVLTASTLLLVSGLLTPLPDAVAAATTLLVVALLAPAVFRPIWRLPQRRWQVPRQVFDDRPEAAARRFAFQLGLGFRTYVTSPAPYAVATMLALVAPHGLGEAAIAAMSVAVTFGIGRSAVVSSHALFGSAAVDQPRWALNAASLCSLVAVAAVAVDALSA